MTKCLFAAHLRTYINSIKHTGAVVTDNTYIPNMSPNQILVSQYSTSTYDIYKTLKVIYMQAYWKAFDIMLYVEKHDICEQLWSCHNKRTSSSLMEDMFGGVTPKKIGEIGLHHTHKENPHIVPLTWSHGEEDVNKWRVGARHLASCISVVMIILCCITNKQNPKIRRWMRKWWGGRNHGGLSIFSENQT